MKPSMKVAFSAFVVALLASSEPALARWVSSDPLFTQDPKKAVASPLEANSYSYSLNSPTNFVDPSGTVGENVIAKAIARVGRGAKTFMRHVRHGHVVGGGRAWGSKFVRGSPERLKGLAQNVLQDYNPGHVVDQGNRVVLQRMFKNAQGTKGERVVRLVVEKGSGRLITMFPAKRFLSIGAGAATLAATEGARAASAASVSEKPTERNWGEAIAHFFAETLIPVAGSATSSMNEVGLAREGLLREAENRTIFQVESEEQRSLSVDEREDIGCMVRAGAAD